MMKIKDWRIKDVDFHVSERKQVTSYVKRMVSIGWQLYGGFVADGLVYGEECVLGEGYESIQLNNMAGGLNPFNV